MGGVNAMFKTPKRTGWDLSLKCICNHGQIVNMSSEEDLVESKLY